MQYALEQPLAIQAEQSERASFIRRTYAHLAGAVLAFTALDFFIFRLFTEAQMESFMVRLFHTPFSNLLILGGFIAVGYVARWWATQGASSVMQYAGLALYVVAEALFFVPILWICVYHTRD